MPEPVVMMARVCSSCGHDLNREDCAEDCAGGEVYSVPYGVPTNDERRTNGEAAAAGEIPF